MWCSVTEGCWERYTGPRHATGRLNSELLTALPQRVRRISQVKNDFQQVTVNYSLTTERVASRGNAYELYSGGARFESKQDNLCYLDNNKD
jgi:hypothetical protein